MLTRGSSYYTISDQDWNTLLGLKDTMPSLATAIDAYMSLFTIDAYGYHWAPDKEKVESSAFFDEYGNDSDYEMYFGWTEYTYSTQFPGGL